MSMVVDGGGREGSESWRSDGWLGTEMGNIHFEIISHSEGTWLKWSGMRWFIMVTKGGIVELTKGTMRYMIQGQLDTNWCCR